MDGKTLSQLFLAAVGQADMDMETVDRRTVFQALDTAASAFARRSRSLTGTAVITTVAGQQAYDLPPDFIEPYVRDRIGRLVGRYDDTSIVHWPVLTSFEKIFRADRTDAQSSPTRFAIIDNTEHPDAVTGTASSAGQESGGAATLTDTSADFTAAVSVRDRVHNITRESAGLVTAVTSGTSLQTALFPEGLDDWASGDTYRIQPAPRRQVYLEAPAESSGHTLKLPYIALPAPVFSDFDTWRLAEMSCEAICYEAAYLYLLQPPRRKVVSQYHRIFTDELSRVAVEIARTVLQGRRYPGRR